MTAPLTYTLEQAAQRLGGPFTVDFLKGHIGELPHIKVGDGKGRGGRIGFSEADLAAIVLMFRRDPQPVADPDDFGRVTRRRSA